MFSESGCGSSDKDVCYEKTYYLVENEAPNVTEELYEKFKEEYKDVFERLE